MDVHTDPIGDTFEFPLPEADFDEGSTDLPLSRTAYGKSKAWLAAHVAGNPEHHRPEHRLPPG